SKQKKGDRIRCPSGARLCRSKNGKCPQLAFGSDKDTSFSIFCSAQTAANQRNTSFKSSFNFNSNIKNKCN
ncbi:MAG: hypothetical protein V4447_08095, partial [Pseudomonadota bacterium]